MHGPCVCACVRASARACVRACVRVCVRAWPIGFVRQGDIHFNALTYINQCEGVRPDVRILSGQLMSYPWCAPIIAAVIASICSLILISGTLFPVIATDIIPALPRQLSSIRRRFAWAIPAWAIPAKGIRIERCGTLLC